MSCLEKWWEEAAPGPWTGRGSEFTVTALCLSGTAWGRFLSGRRLGSREGEMMMIEGLMKAGVTLGWDDDRGADKGAQGRLWRVRMVTK